MNKRLHALAVLAGFLVGFGNSSAHGELNLSPRLESHVLDGVKMSQLVFDTGASNKASYEPPSGWNYSGGQDSLSLRPKNLTQAEVRITKLPAASPVLFDDAGRKALTQGVTESLPKGSEQMKVEVEKLNPLQIDGKSTYLVEVSYVFYGERFACYNLLLDRKPQPLSFRLTCRQSDYQKLRDTFEKSLYSWQNL
ncbi:MAG TPA: hypothetical protein VGI85_12855 [Chthoniobacterales bacterium]